MICLQASLSVLNLRLCGRFYDSCIQQGTNDLDVST
jgi:hypothetical protein